MKKASYFLLTGILVSFFISSCTVEKRVYMSGYNIDWRTSGHRSNKHSTTNNDTENISLHDWSQTATAPKTETAESTSPKLSNEHAVYASTEDNDFFPAPAQLTTTAATTPAATVTKNKVQSRHALLKSLRKVIKATDSGD
jgi:hypothetical protein